MAGAMDIEALLDDLTCPVCYEVPRTGGLFQCPRSHIICEPCFAGLKCEAGGNVRGLQCPFCMELYVIENGFPPRSRLGETLLDTIPMPCKNRGFGCTQELNRIELVVHEDECEVIADELTEVINELEDGRVACKYSDNGCQEMLNEDDLRQHESSCEYQKIPCKYESNGCQSTITLKEEKNHVSGCIYQTMKCCYWDKCSSKMSIAQMSNHLLKKHPDTKEKETTCKAIYNLQTWDDNVLGGFIISQGGTQFFATLGRRREYYKAYVVHLGSPSNTDKYNVIIKLGVPQEARYSMTCKCPANLPANMSKQGFDTLSGLVFSKDFIKSKNKEKGVLKVRLSFSVVEQSETDFTDEDCLEVPSAAKNETSIVPGGNTGNNDQIEVLKTTITRNNESIISAQMELEEERDKARAVEDILEWQSKVILKLKDTISKVRGQPSKTDDEQEQENERLWWAARCGDAETISDLLRQGAEADYSNKDQLGFTGLLAAASGGYTDTIVELLHYGADAEHASEEGVTPLMFAAQNAHVSAVSALLEGGARPDTKCADGRTALHFAAGFGGLEVARTLVEEGRADLDARDLDGESPLVCAHQNKHDDVVEYLESKGAKM